MCICITLYFISFWYPTTFSHYITFRGMWHLFLNFITGVICADWEWDPKARLEKWAEDALGTQTHDLWHDNLTELLYIFFCIYFVLFVYIFKNVDCYSLLSTHLRLHFIKVITISGLMLYSLCAELGYCLVLIYSSVVNTGSYKVMLNKLNNSHKERN